MRKDIFKTRDIPMSSPEHQSAGILDDYAVRKDIQARSINTGSLKISGANLNTLFVPYTSATQEVNLGIWNMNANLFVSTAGIGSIPYQCTSTTKNTNLNADMADGYHFDQGLLTTSSPVFNSPTFTSFSSDSSLVYTDGTGSFFADGSNANDFVLTGGSYYSNDLSPGISATITYLKNLTTSGTLTFKDGILTASA